jgi:DNA repair exonuclease SbcCD ATPase subunit
LGLVPPVFREDFARLGPDEFSGKIKELEEISQNHKREYVRNRALYYIALAHLHYNNPSPDYSKALHYLDEYIAVDTENLDIDEIAVWKSTLNTLVDSLKEYEKLEGSYAQLKQELQGTNKNNESLNSKVKKLESAIEKQKQEIKNLGATIKNLEETIQKLDVIQREIEKKKKKIKL